MSNANWVMIRDHNSRSESCSLFSVHSNCKLDCEAEISIAMMEMISTSIQAHITCAYRWTNGVEKFSFESIDSKISDDEVMRKTSCRLQCWIQVTEWRVYIVENHQNALIEHVIENSWRVMGLNVFDMAGFVVWLENFPICQNGLLLTFQCMSQPLIWDIGRQPVCHQKIIENASIENGKSEDFFKIV